MGGKKTPHNPQITSGEAADRVVFQVEEALQEKWLSHQREALTTQS